MSSVIVLIGTPDPEWFRRRAPRSGECLRRTEREIECRKSQYAHGWRALFRFLGDEKDKDDRGEA